MFIRVGNRIINTEHIACLEMSTVEDEFGEINNVYCDISMANDERITFEGTEAIALEGWFDDKVKAIDVVEQQFAEPKHRTHRFGRTDG